LRTLLVTGAAGFLAGEVARVARARATRVVGVVRAPADLDGFDEVLVEDCASPEMTRLVGHVRPDVVFHGAGSSSVAASYRSPASDFERSLMTWVRTLDACRVNAPDAVVIFPSSAAVYGNPAHQPVAESAPIAPISPYGFHKAAAELLAREYVELYGLSVVVARVFSTFGRRQRRLLVWELAEQARRTGEVVVQGTGLEERDYLAVEDLARTLLALGDRRARGPVNVASGQSILIREVAEAVVRGVGAGSIRYLGERRAGDPSVWRADVSRLASLAPIPHADPRASIEALVRVWTTD